MEVQGVAPSYYHDAYFEPLRSELAIMFRLLGNTLMYTHRDTWVRLQ